MSENLLFEDSSPNGNVVALVEQDDRCAYLYLHGSSESEFGVRCCWVRNLKPAPPGVDAEARRKRSAPLIPARACAHPSGAPPLRAEHLRFVWFEEGDAGALLENDEILAIIPGWSGATGFHGYARDCTMDTPVCSALTPDNVLPARVRRAEEFWRSWETGRPWGEFQAAGMEAIERALGRHCEYHAVGGEEWPPKALLGIPRGDATLLVSCGVGIRPQPKAEQAAGAPLRIELGLAVDAGVFERNARALMGYVAGQATLPWARHTWLGPGHTVACNAIPGASGGSSFEAMLLMKDPPGAPVVALPPYRGDAVELLWMIPITRTERELAMRHGSAALALRLRLAGHGWIHRNRLPVV